MILNKGEIRILPDISSVTKYPVKRFHPTGHKTKVVRNEVTRLITLEEVEYFKKSAKTKILLIVGSKWGRLSKKRMPLVMRGIC